MRRIDSGFAGRTYGFVVVGIAALGPLGIVRSAAVAEEPQTIQIHIDGAVAPASATTSAGTESTTNSDDRLALATPTHHQTGLIKVNVDGLPQRDLTCFALTPDDRILAGCAGGKGEIRVFDAEGKYLESWAAPFEPEAIFVRHDGAIYLAGRGQVARLSPTGEVELQKKAPHADSMGQNLDRIRKEVVEQNQRQAEVYSQQAQQYDELLKQVDRQIDDAKKQLADLNASDAQQKLTLKRKLAMQQQMKTQYEQIKKQWDEMIAQNQPKELSEEEIDKLVEDSIKYKLKVSSISATEDNVYLATRAAVGYGFDVWKMAADFTDGKQIITGLSGCCGQMDVKANADGLFVAENSKHHVACYDHDGKLIDSWGHGARTGLEGFGSCCNPMNVAFGPGGAVYTAEDDTGRIKRYSPDGKLLGLVGASELTPGCMNVSIAVSSDGGRVFMLDVTRGQIVRMDRYAPGKAPVPATIEEEPPADTVSFNTSPGEPPNVGGAVAKGLLRVLGFGK